MINSTLNTVIHIELDSKRVNNITNQERID